MGCKQDKGSIQQMSGQRNNEPAWVILTERYGEDIDEPSPQNIKDALDALYQPTLPGMSEEGEDEHPNVWLRYGFDEGPLYTLDLYRSGLMIFSHHADADYDQLIAEHRMQSVGRDMALRMLLWLLEGNLNELAAQPWTQEI